MISSLKRFISRSPDMQAVISRFPAPVLIMTVFTVLIMFFQDGMNDDKLIRLLAGLVIGAYLCVIFTLAREAKQRGPMAWPQSGLQIGLGAAFGLIGWFSENLGFNLVMAMGAVLLWLGNAVIWRLPRNDTHVWDFTHKLWTGALFAFAGSVIYAVGILAIRAALKSLFGLNIQWLAQHVFLPIGLGFLAPLYWLSTLPPVDESYDDLVENPSFISKAVAFLGTWLLAPLTLIYAFIVLAYGVKIGVSMHLPNGEIAQLTTPFLIVGTLTWLLLAPPFIGEKWLARLFRKLWFPLSIPAAILLAIAVFVRIGDYGVTPERLALLFCVIWALAIGLWFSLGPKAKRDIRIIPGFAAAVLALGAILSIPLSHINQTARAGVYLKAAGIMGPNGTVPAVDKITIIDEKAAQKAKGAIAYLIGQNQGERLEKLFAGSEAMPVITKTVSPDLFKRLGLSGITTSYRGQARYLNFRDEFKALDVRGFETLYGPYPMYDNSAKGDDHNQVIAEIGSMIVTYRLGMVTAAIGDDVRGQADVKAWVQAAMIDNSSTLKPESNIIPLLDAGERQASLVIKTISFNRDAIGDHRNMHGDVAILVSGIGETD